MTVHLRWGLAVACLLVAWPTGLMAQGQPSSQDPTPVPRGESSGQPAKDDPDEKAVGFRWRDGLSLRLGGHGHIDFRARLQFEGVSTDGARPEEEDDAALDLARRRVGIEGELFDVVTFEIEREISGDQPWRDVFVDVRAHTALQVQAGHFRLPFSLDANTGATSLDFAARSLAARALAPGRDPGAMLHGRLLPHRIVRYELGVFRQDGRNARTRNPARVTGGRTVAGRVTVQPWRTRTHPLEDLHVGIALTRSAVPEGRQGLRGASVLDLVFADPETPVLGTRARLGAEFRWRPGPTSIKAEYLRVSTERQTQSVDDDDLPPLLGEGWYVSGTWVLTGERKADGLRRPRRPVHRGGWGAIELAGRLERLAFRSDGGIGEPSTSPRAQVVPPESVRVITAGVNWYLNTHVKVQVNAVRETFTDAARSPVPGQAVILSQVLRVQLTL